MTVVPNRELLRDMAKAGLIELHSDFKLGKVRHWTGQMTPVYYVGGVCDGVKQPFEFRGRMYELKYFDGCFAPFVIDIELAEDLGVRYATLIA